MSQKDKAKRGRQNLLRGNWGEQYIAERLSACECFIRHVPQGHDTGIDLYCETTTDDSASFLHFWCQVKTSKKYKGVKSYITLPRKNMKVAYWLKQPVPVFIFVVPDFREKGIIPFYIFNAIDFYNNNEKISSLLKVEKPEDLAIFLNNELPKQTFRWDLMRGRISHLPASKPENAIKFPIGQTQNFESKLQESLRWTLRILADDILYRNDSNSISDAKPYVEMLETLAVSKDDKHYETYEVIGKYYFQKQDFQKAIENYKKSLKILQDDQNIKDDDCLWEPVFKRIKDKIRQLESGKNNYVESYNTKQEINDVCATKTNIKM